VLQQVFFPFDEQMQRYLHITKRIQIVKLCNLYANELCADENAKYDQVIEIGVE